MTVYEREQNKLEKDWIKKIKNSLRKKGPPAEIFTICEDCFAEADEYIDKWTGQAQLQPISNNRVAKKMMKRWQKYNLENELPLDI
ncbi:MAG: hypothetical protein GF364_09280 [Candidatus Lokiarchaeota archaeon]|nr:hypothetical protein [Candidatus Lokiarchaeota archaeon]